MKHYKLFIFIAVFSLNCTVTLRSDTLQKDPYTAAKEFYRLLVQLNIQGLPDSKQQQHIGPLLSTKLRMGLNKAQKDRSEFIKKHGDMLKPPWDEFLFGSLYEGITGYSLGKAVVTNESVTIPIYLQYSRNHDITKWIDLLILIKEDGSWYVHDIIYGGSWQFKNSGSLLQHLFQK